MKMHDWGERDRVREFLAEVYATDPNDIARLYAFFKHQVGYEDPPERSEAASA